MRDVTKIDFSKPHGKVRSMDPSKQKVYFRQDGIDYNSTGTACSAKQVKEHYSKIASSAQLAADEAKEAAANAQSQADEMLKSAGITKTAARKAG